MRNEVEIISHHYLRRRARARQKYLNDSMTVYEGAQYHYRVRPFHGAFYRWCVTKVAR